MVVAQIMSPNPVVVSVTDSIARAATRLMETDVRHLPVVDRGALVGILSDRDLRGLVDTALLAPVGESSTLSRPVSTLMSSDVITVYPESTLEEVIDLMIEYRIGAVPVVEVDSSRVIGIVSYIDVLRAARSALS